MCKSVHVLKQSSKGFKWKRIDWSRERWVFFIPLARWRAWLPRAFFSPTPQLACTCSFIVMWKIHIHVKTYCTEVLLNNVSLLPILAPIETHLFDNGNYFHSRIYIFWVFFVLWSPTTNIYRNDGDGNLNLRLRSYVRQFYTIDPLVQLKLAGMYCEPVEIFFIIWVIFGCVCPSTWDV